MYLIKETAQLSGVSVRTLHHYDRIGLLSPQKADNGYRYYTDEDLGQLQQILFYKYLGFSLQQIKQLLQDEEIDHLDHLEEQLRRLEQEQERLSTLVTTIKKTIQEQKGLLTMTAKEKFAGFAYDDHRHYHDQAVKAYGKDIVDQGSQRQKGQEERVVAGFNHVFHHLTDNLASGKPATDTANQSLAEQLLTHIRTYAFDCSLDVFGYIGQGYVNNPDFQKNIDQFGAGLAQYTCDVIQHYVQLNS